MFYNPFSFSGRIRRLEYGLSYLVYICCLLFSAFLFDGREGLGLLVFFVMIAIYWFLLAQGSKRCHDLGNSGFFQLIPFYGLFMLFEEGKSETNEYGPNPKLKPENKTEIGVLNTAPTIDSKSKTALLNELISLALINTLLVVLCLYFIENLSVANFFGFITIIPCYFLLLTLSNKEFGSHNTRFYLLQHRLVYSLASYIFVELYLVVFQKYQFEFIDIFLSLFIILFICGVTYIPQVIYTRYQRKKSYA